MLILKNLKRIMIIFVNCNECKIKCKKAEWLDNKLVLSKCCSFEPCCHKMYLQTIEHFYKAVESEHSVGYIVDTFSIQHPGAYSSPTEITKLGVHLLSLYMHFMKNLDAKHLSSFKSKLLLYNEKFHIIEKFDVPNSLGESTIKDVWDNLGSPYIADIAKDWAFQSFQHWQENLPKLNEISREFLEKTDFYNKTLNRYNA